MYTDDPKHFVILSCPILSHPAECFAHRSIHSKAQGESFYKDNKNLDKLISLNPNDNRLIDSDVAINQFVAGIDAGYCNERYSSVVCPSDFTPMAVTLVDPAETVGLNETPFDTEDTRVT